MIAGTRRQAVVVCTALLLGLTGGPVSAQAQTDTVPGVATSGQTGTTATPDPSAIPQLTPETTTPSQATTPSRTTTTTTPDSGSSGSTVTTPRRPLPSTLPDTGLDGRIIAGLGLGLLLCGVGLRLRTARERF